MREFRTIRGEHFVAKETFEDGVVEVELHRIVGSKQLAEGLERIAAWSIAHASILGLDDNVVRVLLRTRADSVGSAHGVRSSAAIYRALGDGQWVAELEEAWWQTIAPNLQMQGLLEDHRATTSIAIESLEKHHDMLAESVQNDGRLVNNELDDLRAEVERARDEMLDALRQERDALAQRIADLELLNTIQHDEEVARQVRTQSLPRWRKLLRQMVGV